MNDSVLPPVLAELRQARGLDLSGYRRSTLERRLAARLVHFSRHDLTSRHSFAPADSVFGSFDLVLCRNVLIYFSLELQKRVRTNCTAP